LPVRRVAGPVPTFAYVAIDVAKVIALIVAGVLLTRG
jgi:hypothetical protein